MEIEPPNHAELSKPSDGYPLARVFNIAFRTTHIGTTGLLFGGHAFDVDPDRLWIWFYLSIFTGVCLILLESSLRLRWCCQGRGILVLSKLLVLCAIPWFWPYRSSLLIAVILLGSVGSHMPRRFRYYSIVHRRVLK
ncbi:MAG: hypothetical protein JW829_16475 [Pirellulales bacterium]|nr:hypothetical protein [Pirellulales bacterium]